MKALQELENVDDDADQLGIAFVKINDPELADEYSLGSLPALVYYRRRIPVVYDGKREKEGEEGRQTLRKRGDNVRKECTKRKETRE